MCVCPGRVIRARGGRSAAYPSLLDAHGVLVAGINRSVVACRGTDSVYVGAGVFVVDQVLRRGKCDLAPGLTPGDRYWIVRSLCLQVQPPVNDGALMGTRQSAVATGELFDRCVEPALQDVGGRGEPVRVHGPGRWLEVVEQQFPPVQRQQRMIGGTDPWMGEHLLVLTGHRVLDGGLLVEPVLVDGTELLEVRGPFGGLVQGGDPGQLQGQTVDGFPCVGAWPAGGVAATTRWAWTRHRWMIVVGHVEVIAEAAPWPPSMTAINGAGIGLISSR